MNKERNVEMENNAHTSRELLLIKKKRRRRKKMLIFLTVLLCLLAIAGGGFLLWQRSQRAAQEAVQITAGENEEITYARISTIVGNEIEAALLEGAAAERTGTAGTQTADDAASAGDAASENNVTSADGEMTSEGTAEGGMSDGGTAGGEMQGGMSEGGMPDSGTAEGGTPDGDLPQQDASGFAAGGQSGRSAYTETGETKSWQIPVGTDVITSLGVTTTFSRLSAGDVIAVLTEEGTDNILKIWIVE